ALATMALQAAKASRPAAMSFGLCSSVRIARPRSASTAAVLPRRRRGISSSSLVFLGTSLHLNWLFLRCDSDGGRKGRDVADRMRRLWLAASQRQRNGDGGALADLAVQAQIAAMQADEAFDDRQAEARAFMAALIGLAGLKERIADPFEIVGRDADAVVAHPQYEARAFNGRGHRDLAATLGELEGVGNEIDHDLLERAGVP